MDGGTPQFSDQRPTTAAIRNFSFHSRHGSPSLLKAAKPYY